MAYFRVAYSDPLDFASLFNCQDQKASKLHSSKASFCSHKEESHLALRMVLRLKGATTLGICP